LVMAPDSRAAGAGGLVTGFEEDGCVCAARPAAKYSVLKNKYSVQRKPICNVNREGIAKGAKKIVKLGLGLGLSYPPASVKFTWM